MGSDITCRKDYEARSPAVSPGAVSRLVLLKLLKLLCAVGLCGSVLLLAV